MYDESMSVLAFDDGTNQIVPKFGDLVTVHRVDISGTLGLQLSLRADKPDMILVQSSEGAAYRAGIRKNARIVAVDREPVRHENSVNDIVEDRRDRGKMFVTFQCRQPVDAVDGIDYIETFTDVDDEPTELDAEAVTSYDDATEGEEMTTEDQIQFERFVDKVMEVFDADKDGILNYKEHSDIFRAVGGVPYSREQFEKERPNGFTKAEYRDVLRREPGGNKRVFMQRMNEWFDRNAPKKPAVPPQHHHHHHHQPRPLRPSDPIIHFGLSQGSPGADDDLPPGPYPTAWGIQRGAGGSAKPVRGPGRQMEPRMVDVDLRADSNHELKNALILCGRELERRLAESKEAHDYMEQGLVRVNQEAVAVFGGYDLNSLLKIPGKRDLANGWAARKMQEIHVPPKLLRDYYNKLGQNAGR